MKLVSPLLRHQVHSALEGVEVPLVTVVESLALFLAMSKVSKKVGQGSGWQGGGLSSWHYDQNILIACMWTLEQKQHYLKENISEQEREDFWGYLQEEVGNYDIEKWTDSFIIHLVNKFKETKRQQNLGHQTSFYQYQAREAPESISTTNNILQALNNQTEIKIQYQPQKPEQQKQSAFALLDSIFQKKAQSVSTPDPRHFQTGPQLNTVDKEDSFKVSSFATNQFWELGSKGHKVSKITADFASFDFWSQPSSLSSSPENPKKNNPDAYSQKNLAANKQTSAIPSFDQLIVNYNKQKGPSPYTKKSNANEAKTEIVVDRVEESNTTQPVIVPQKMVAKSQLSSGIQGTSKSKARKVLYDGEVVIKNEFQAAVKCFPATQRARLKDSELRVTIDGHQIIQRTFLMPDYAMYHIHIYPHDIVVKRNYQDFSRLRNTLAKLFPGIKLSYLQQNSWFSKTNAEFIKSQKVMLQFFLNDLIKNPEIKNSRILQDFLTIPDHKKIKRRFEEWEKLEAPKGIEQLCWLGGQVQVNLSEKQRLYQEHFKRYHARMIDFLDKHQRLTDTMLEQYRELDFTQNELVNLTKAMMDQTTYFNERVYGFEVQKMNEAFALVHSCLCQENKTTKFYIQTLSEMILPFVKYQKQNVSQLQGLMQLQESFFKSYIKRSTLQKVDEATPYESQKIKGFKNGVLQQSRSILVLKYQAGFLSNQTCSEGHRVIETLAQKYISLFKDYGRLCKQKSAEMLEYWNSDAYTRQLATV